MSRYLPLILTAFFWGATFNVGKLAMGVLPPLTVVAWRFVLAAACMALLLWRSPRPDWTWLRPRLWRYAALGGLGIFASQSLLFLGLARTSPVNAALIMATNPLLTALLAAGMLGQRLRGVALAGMALSLLGVLFVLTGGQLGRLGSISPGDLLVLAGNLCWALYGVLGRKYLPDSPPLTTTALTMIAGALCFVPVLALGTAPAAPAPGALTVAWAAIAFMALCASVLAYLWWNRGLATLGVGTTSLFFNLVPVFTLLVSAVGGAHVSGAQLAGMLLVPAGVVLASSRALPRSVPAPASR